MTSSSSSPPDVSQQTNAAIIDQPDPADELDAAPAVVVVVATNNPGPWFEESLGSIGAQDYSNVSVLVIDAASTEDLSGRVAEILPNAFVRRLTDNPGYAAASNEVLQTVEGAALLLFCHDDVLLDSTAVRFMVEEAYRSNAAIIAPKVVEWDAPDRLITVGGGADKLGVFLRNVEIGEVDQGQHDAVREVFVAPGGCMLVRADLFRAVGGFDEHMRFTGEDVDLCWRAQLLGARIVCMPAARVRHKLMGSRGKRMVRYVAGLPGSRKFRDHLREARAESSLRTILKNYGFWRLCIVLPQMLVVGVIETIYGLFTGRLGLGQAFFGALTFNIRNFGSLRSARKRVQSTRQITDRQIRKQQSSLRQRVATYWRTQFAYDTPDKKKANSTWRRAPKATAAVWGSLIAVQLIAARGLIFGPLPEVGLIRNFSVPPTEILGMWAHPGRIGELSLSAPSSVGLAILSCIGVVLFNSLSATIHIVVALAPLIGAVAMFVAARPLGIPAQLTATVVYSLVPVAPNAVADGNLPALAIYFALPMMIRLVMALSEAELFTGTSRKVDLIRLGLIVAIGASFFIDFIPVIALIISGSVIGVLISGAWTSFPRSAARGLATLAITMVLVPALLILLLAVHGGWDDWLTLRATNVPALSDFMSLNISANRFGVFGWFFVFASMFVLFVGRRTRLFAGTLLWCIALASAITVELMARDLWPLHISIDVLFAVYCAALSFLIALGVRAFADDLHRYQFGLRQALTVVSAVGLIACILPFIGGMFSGRWHAPTTSRFAELGWMNDIAKDEGPFRTMFIGADEDLPSRPWPVTRDLSSAFTQNGEVGREGAYAGLPNASANSINHQIQQILDQKANQLEEKLTQNRVRYVVVVPSRSFPDPPNALVRALNQNLELQRPVAAASTVVFENADLAKVNKPLPENPAALWNVAIFIGELLLWTIAMYTIRRLTPEGYEE